MADPTVPDVSSVIYATGVTTLVTAGYIIGVTTYQSSETIAAGYIVETYPAAGATLAAGAAVDITVSSGASVDYPDAGTLIPAPDEDLTTKRDTVWFLQWIETEFLPLTLATPETTLNQCLENAIRYWNTHSAYRISTMFDYDGSKRIQLNTQFKSVVEVLPCVKSTWIWNEHPMWTLLGVTVIDNVTSDLILMSEAYKNYRTYLGADMRWQFEKSENPDTEGGYLYVQNVPYGVSALAVIGTKRIVSNEYATQEYIKEWILSYSKALVKQCEGNILRKSGIVGIKNDGQELVNEGKEEMKDLQERLTKDGRWTAFLKRG